MSIKQIILFTNNEEPVQGCEKIDNGLCRPSGTVCVGWRLPRLRLPLRGASAWAIT